MKTGVVRQIANLAYTMEPDRGVVYHWILGERLPQLGGRTALELAFRGEAQRVLRLLQQCWRDGARRLPVAADSA